MCKTCHGCRLECTDELILKLSVQVGGQDLRATVGKPSLDLAVTFDMTNLIKRMIEPAVNPVTKNTANTSRVVGCHFSGLSCEPKEWINFRIYQDVKASVAFREATIEVNRHVLKAIKTERWTHMVLKTIAAALTYSRLSKLSAQLL